MFLAAPFAVVATCEHLVLYREGRQVAGLESRHDVTTYRFPVETDRRYELVGFGDYVFSRQNSGSLQYEAETTLELTVEGATVQPRSVYYTRPKQ